MAIALDQLQKALGDRYDVRGELGRGGMAVVFEAWDNDREGPVALKVLHPELAQTVGGERFLRETRIAQRLGHPHIVPVYDSGRAGPYVYYTMQLAPGESLHDRLEREGQLPVDEALEITRQVASALDYAHGQGVVHRDLKPGNIMLTDGSAVVTDFGIARAVDDAGERLTETGLAMGTPAYMAPEQAESDRRLDGRADQYSLACVLYEMLAGHPPFSGASAQVVISRHMKDPLPSLGTARSTVTGPVESVVAKALAKTPADRFRGVKQFSEALDIAEQGVTPRNVTPYTGTQAYPQGIWGELARRRVYQVAASYVMVAFGLIEIVETLGPNLRIPAVFSRWLQWSAVAGFPVMLLVSWAFELTPSGLKRTQAVGITPSTGVHALRPWHRIAMTLSVVLVGVAGLLLSMTTVPDTESSVSDPVSAVSEESPDPRKLVILPLRDLTPEAGFESLGGAVAYRITDQVDQLAAATMNELPFATMSFALALDIANRTDGAASAIAAAIEIGGAGTALVGHYRVFQDSLELRAEITDAGNMTQVGVAEFTGPVSDADQIVEEFAQRVLGELAREFDLNWTLGGDRSPRLGAMIAYVEAHEVFSRNADLSGSLAKYEEALAIDSGFVTAALWAGVRHRDLVNLDEAERYFDFVEARLDRLGPQARADYEWEIGTFFRETDLPRKYRSTLEYDEVATVPDQVAKFELGLNLPRRAMATIDEAGGLGRPTGFFFESTMYAIALHTIGEHETEERLADSLRVERSPSVLDGVILMRKLIALAARGELEDLRALIPQIGTLGRSPFPPGCVYGYAGRELWAHGEPELSAELLVMAADWFDENETTFDVTERTECEFGIPGAAEHARALYEVGRLGEARALYERLLTAGPELTWLRNLYQVYIARIEAQEGNAKRAREIIDSLSETPGLWQHSYRGMAAVASIMGELDLAFELLERAQVTAWPTTKGDWNLAYLVHWDPDFENLHGHTRYDELLRPKG